MASPLAPLQPQMQLELVLVQVPERVLVLVLVLELVSELLSEQPLPGLGCEPGPVQAPEHDPAQESELELEQVLG